MGSDSKGRNNRIAGNDFHEERITAENYIARDFVNIAVPAIEKDTRPLVPAQRKQLHQLILAVAEAGNEEGYEVWHRVHAEIGVRSVEEMTVSQYQPAYSYLQAQLDLCREKSQKNELISALLKISANTERYNDLLQYCRKRFGSSHLKNLQRTELQQALLWLDEERSGSNEVAKTAPVRVQWGRLAWDNPVFTGAVFLAGFFVDAVIVYFFP
ncbi:hypothetical protein [Serratia ficaria]|uniref:hypothetical protein n=1 Tax=Serratia ficaria TaxID=61651 RepID=UPI002178BC59|nr:hypothetical protein [Serratia ficaria]CAI0698551.1 flagella biosynthesis regulator [Serratia ficaria]CAI2430800.1 flagella biosynthesis regulator [Serratia ficaria]